MLGISKSVLLGGAVMLLWSASSAVRIPLEGIWDFRLEKDRSMEELRLPDFSPDDKMPVPGCWDAASRYYNQRGTGCYRRAFELKADTPQAFLVVDGFALRCKFWLDGREIGFSKLPWSRVEFAAGPLKAGRHELVAAVDSIVDNAKVKLFWNFYDFYPSGGLYHGIWLEALEKSCEVRKIVVRTRDYRTGRVELEAQFAGDGAPSDFTADVAFDGGAAQKVAFKNRRATLEVPNFKLWTPESPNLHFVAVTLSTSTSSLHLVDATRQRFGIRQVSTEKGNILLNGRPIWLKGVNRHEAHPEFGGATPLAVMYEDVRNLKSLGGNFLRGSHYPQCQSLLDLCDELGILVWEESLGWGNGPEQLDDPEFCDLQEEETRLMVRNSINHPSVIITGFLNEPQSSLPSCRALVDRLVAAVRAEDSGHLVTYAANYTSTDASHVKTDLISYNTYPCWYNDELKTGTPEEMRANIRRCHQRIVKYFREKYQDDRPILVSEIGVKADYGVHDPRGKAQYTEDFQAEYTRIMLEEVFDNPDLAGVAIWQFTDCKTYTRTEGLRNRAYGVNTGGLYDLYRRPKLAVEEVRKAFQREPARLAAGDSLTVTMEPGEHWWGIATGCGELMPFDEKSSVALDIRKDGYSNPYQSLLVSDHGRYIWSETQVAMSATGGVMKIVGPGVELVRAGKTLKEAFLAASKAHFPPSGKTPDLTFYAAPQYCTWIELTYHQNEKGILAYAQSMLDHGLPPGVLIIDDTWQAGYGDWRFEASRFSDPKGMVEKLHAMGFKVLLWMCPFVQSDSPAFRLLTTGIDPASCVRREKTGGLLCGDKWDSADPIERPAAVSWWNGQSALVDFTDPVGRDWFRGECDRLRRDYGVDGFKMDGGHLNLYSRGYRAHEDVSSGLQARAYGEVCLAYPLCEFRNAFGLAGQPIVERLSDKDHSWEHLRKCVTDMIAAGLLGYSFVCPDMAGGGQWISFLPGSALDQELFVRSCQMQALCGMMQISASPWRVLDAEHQELVRQAVALRQRFVPKFLALAKECAKTGEPFLRALEYEFPNRGYASVKDEFMIGDFLLVAPQLVKGAATREVILPPGEWQSDDGSRVQGPARLTIQTPLSRLPHFIRTK